MKKVAILGVGLIGGSLGMALRKVKVGKKRVYHVSGFSPSAKSRRQAKKKGAVDAIFSSAQEAVQGRDIVVLAAPPQATQKILRSIRSSLKKNALVTDVGSVKVDVMKAARQTLKSTDVSFVGAHPIAGSEKKGVGSSTADLFKGATCVLTKDGANRSSLSKASSFWKSVGAKPIFMSAKKHDEILSLTSHTPHLLAFILFEMVFQKGKRAHGLTAGAFRDMTRIAGADGALWAGIFSANRRAIKRDVSTFLKEAGKLMGLKPASLQKKLASISEKKKRSPL